MEEKLLALGFNKKEAKVYLALLEFGNQPASVIAKKLGMAKASVLFLLGRLVDHGYVRKSKKGRAQYFYADPADLKRAKEEELAGEAAALKSAIPLLKEFKNPFTSPPKVTFFEGLDGCRKAYSLLLESKTDIREFATHEDLLKMGEDFMLNFIKERSARGIFMKDVCTDVPVHRDFKKRDKKEKRDQFLFSEKVGKLYSSISVFENKVLLMNLYHDAFAILIENKEVAETLKTIHMLVRGD